MKEPRTFDPVVDQWNTMTAEVASDLKATEAEVVTTIRARLTRALKSRSAFGDVRLRRVCEQFETWRAGGGPMPAELRNAIRDLEDREVVADLEERNRAASPRGRNDYSL